MPGNYHAGELAVQARAGVREIAERAGRSIRPTLPPIARNFLRNQPFAVLGTMEESGRLWATLVTGEPGFLKAPDEATLEIRAGFRQGDPVGRFLRAGDPAGALIIDPATRRRMRVNGTLESVGDGRIVLKTREVFSNCPKYIQAREWESAGEHEAEKDTTMRDLGDEEQEWIRGADTFFIATSDGKNGVDASHRGGNPGFLRVRDGKRLVWPDYTGNSMFQTLGNLAVHDQCGLLFIDWERGETLQLSGRARVVWEEERLKDFAGAERLVEFEMEEAVRIEGGLPLRWRFVDYSPYNPRAK